MTLPLALGIVLALMFWWALALSAGLRAQSCDYDCTPPTQSCVGELNCYDLPVHVDTGGQAPAAAWSGYFDKRLNPRMDEYYLVWCEFDQVKVYRIVPETLLVKVFPIALVVLLGVGASADLGDFMTLMRNSEDTMTIYGSNGNGAPTPGEKAFSLRECIERNGSAPLFAPMLTPSPTPTPNLLAVPTPAPNFYNVMRDELVYTILRHLNCASIFAFPGGFGLLRWIRRKRPVK